MLGLTALGLVILRVPAWGWWLVAIGLAAAGMGAITALERVPFEPQAGVRWREVWKVPMSRLR
jgi:hypothetical protein